MPNSKPSRNAEYLSNAQLSQASRPENRPLDSTKTLKKEADLKPHRFRYWLTPKPDPAFDAKCADICEVYQAAAGADERHRTVSLDEMTGMQALERSAPGLPMKPGKVERCEFEYRRHGTQTLIAGFDVTIGRRGDRRHPDRAGLCTFSRHFAEHTRSQHTVGYRLRQPQHPSLRVRRSPCCAALRPRRRPRHQR